MKNLHCKLFAAIGFLFFIPTFPLLFNESDATWGQEFEFEFKELGGLILGSPSCAVGGLSDVICGVRGTNNLLHVIRFTRPDAAEAAKDPPPRPGSMEFEKLEGLVIIGNPSCVRLGDEFVCAVVGTDNALYAIGFNPFNNYSRTEFRKLGERVIVGNPSCARLDFPDVVCGVRGTENALYGIRFNVFNPSPDFTSEYQPLGGTIVDDPSCVPTRQPVADNRLSSETVICGVRGTDNNLHVIGFDPRTMSRTGFFSVGRAFLGSPSCTDAEFFESEMVCGVRGTDNNLYGVLIFLSDPRPLATRFSFRIRNLGGPIEGNPSCTSKEGVRPVTCGVSMTNVLFGITFDVNFNTRLNEFRTRFRNMGAVFVGNPSCTVLSQGQICAVVGLNNALFAFELPDRCGFDDPRLRTGPLPPSGC
jgi:hypothetical protein